MFQLLPWVEGKFHILCDGAVIGSTYLEDECCFVLLNATNIEENAAEIELEDLLELKVAVSKAYLSLVPPVEKPTHSTQQLGQGIPSRGSTPIKVPVENAPVTSKSKWAKYLNGQPHTMTLKQTGYKNVAGFRSNMFSFTKKQGYSFSSTVSGKGKNQKITFTCTKN